MSLLLHPLWWDARPYMRVEVSPDGPRLAVRMPPDHVRRQMLAATMPCVCCGVKVNPFTFDYGRLVFTPTCEAVWCRVSIDEREERHAVMHALREVGQVEEAHAPRLPWG